MDIQQLNRNALIALLFSVFFTPCGVVAEDFDFRELLNGLSADLDEERRRLLHSEIRETLTGREEEVWAFVEASLSDEDGNFNASDFHEGLTALFLIDGFNDQILDKYLAALEAEASNIDDFNELLSRRGSRDLTAEDEAFADLTKRTKLLSVGFGVFDQYRDGLPREIATKYLRVEESALSDKVFEWYQKHGTEEDIEALEERADELRERGDSVGARNVESAIAAINARTDPLDEKKRGEAGQASTTAESVPGESERDEEQFVPTSSRSPVWPYVLVAVALVGIVVVLLRSRKVNPDR